MGSKAHLKTVRTNDNAYVVESTITAMRHTRSACYALNGIPHQINVTKQPLSVYSQAANMRVMRAEQPTCMRKQQQTS
jgi:hypothetical protein